MLLEGVQVGLGFGVSDVPCGTQALMSLLLSPCVCRPPPHPLASSVFLCPGVLEFYTVSCHTELWNLLMHFSAAKSR